MSGRFKVVPHRRPSKLVRSGEVTLADASERWLAPLLARPAPLLVVVLAVAYLAVMPAERRASHSPYNHYALQARAWLDGRLDLGGPPPGYTGNNDFARHGGKTYVSFPPAPAALLLPFVAVAGRPEAVKEPLLFALLAPLGPLFFFLALERLRDAGRLPGRKPRDNLALALTLGLGTVYWFCAVQGSVWFVGHVVTVVCATGYLWASIGAARPFLAGLFLALAVGTRPTLAFAAPLFLYEVRRVGDRKAWRLGRWLLPLVVVGALIALHNQARFGDPLEFGHRLLDVRWRDRIDRLGLFNLRYLGKNATVLALGVPFPTPEGWRINAHGLALWVCTPALLWLLRPGRGARDGLAGVALSLGLLIAFVTLLYQNTGWVQYGPRFANDYLWLLLLAIALDGEPLRRPFWALVVAGVLVNAVGAFTFGRPGYERLLWVEPTQRVLVWPGGPTAPVEL